MKNVRVLTEPDEIRRHAAGLWKTEEFRESYDSGGYVRKVVDSFARQPRFFWDATDTRKENAHFTAWWGGIMNRDYDNDAVHDLYLLHEMYHAGTMVHVPGLEFENFRRKMFDNELDASVCSEIRAYFEMPGLRAKSFQQEIFADRFLNDAVCRERWKEDPEGLMQEIRLLRRNAMLSGNPRDMCEYWIHKFSSQNEAWAAVWSHRYDAVETAMAGLRDRCRTAGRGAAMEEFMTWLRGDGVTDGTEIPFHREAEAFAGIYWQNKAEYQAAMDAQKRPPAAPRLSGPRP